MTVQLSTWASTSYNPGGSTVFCTAVDPRDSDVVSGDSGPLGRDTAEDGRGGGGIAGCSGRLYGGSKGPWISGGRETAGCNVRVDDEGVGRGAAGLLVELGDGFSGVGRNVGAFFFSSAT